MLVNITLNIFNPFIHADKYSLQTVQVQINGSLQINTDTLANSADPDETARRAVSSGSQLFAILFLICD